MIIVELSVINYNSCHQLLHSNSVIFRVSGGQSVSESPTQYLHK